MDIYELDKVREDIALLTRSEKKARLFVQMLAETNWQQVFHTQDKSSVECLTCKQMYVPGRYDILSCHFNMCLDCREKRGWDTRLTLNRENRKFHQSLERAEKLDLPVTLTFSEWVMTLHYFDWKCAYCLVNSYQILDHFIPLAKQGGTTVGNCVPACKECSKAKWAWHPDEVTGISREALERVRTCLEQFSKASEIAPLSP